MTNTKSGGPYTFRIFWAAVLLGINLLVAAYYFHIIE
ncbi:photosystem I protein PsaX [Lyngbya sp. CCY1209]|nr:photosystem I protein PsaX [Lyngbya sp. CCY1209]MEB3883349.1 photosystem I protein PsaX [Lyngbya sp. CCY1209]